MIHFWFENGAHDCLLQSLIPVIRLVEFSNYWLVFCFLELAVASRSQRRQFTRNRLRSILVVSFERTRLLYFPVLNVYIVKCTCMLCKSVATHQSRSTIYLYRQLCHFRASRGNIEFLMCFDADLDSLFQTRLFCIMRCGQFVTCTCVTQFVPTRSKWCKRYFDENQIFTYLECAFRALWCT